MKRHGSMAGTGRINPRMRRQAADAILRRMGGGSDGVEDMKVGAGETGVKSTLEIWTDQQAHVITRLHHGYSSIDVAQELGITKRRVNQIRRQGYAACKKAGSFVLCWKNI